MAKKAASTPAASPASKGPDPFLAKAKAAAKSGGWKAFNDAKANNFDDPEIEDGRYLCTFGKCKTAVTKSGIPTLEITGYVKDGEYKGARLRAFFYDCFDDEKSAGRMAQALQRFGYDTSAMEPADLVTLRNELNTEKPDFFFKVENKEITSEKDGTVSHRLNQYVDGLATADAAEPAAKASTVKPKAKGKTKKQ